MKLALGPLQYYWPREQVFSFYQEIAGSPVEMVYLGETVCSRRHELRLNDWLDIASQLDAAGKQVVLSTQVLIESDADLMTVRKIVGNGRFLVEANEMGAVRCLNEAGLPFVAGPYLNLFNAVALDLLSGQGAIRWVMPFEMGQADLAEMQQARSVDVETEVFSYGRIPLAFSARCFTARHHNLPKDNCQFSCIRHPEGLPLRTRDAQSFLNLNGIQTQSSRVCNLVRELQLMPELGVNVVRISPQAAHTVQIIDIFHAVLTSQTSIENAQRQLEGLMPDAACNGFWHGQSGMAYVA